MIELIFNFYHKKKSIESLENSAFCEEKKLDNRSRFLESKWTLSFKNFQNIKIGHKYHVFMLYAAWSCFGAWKTTFWAWSFEFFKPQIWSYNQTLQAGTSMSPYLKSLGPDFWYCYYFLKKLNFSTLHQQKPSKTLTNCLKSMQNSEKNIFFEAKIRISQIHLICFVMMWNGSWSVSTVPKFQFHAYMTPRNIFEKIFKNSKSATNILFSRFM